MGSESSADPAGTKKGFGDVWVARFDNPAGERGDSINDGKRFLGSVIIEKGSSSPGTGLFNDKTAIQADRTGGECDGNAYFSWSRFTGRGVSNIYLARSTDHGATWSHPLNLTPNTKNVQFPDISVTGNGHVTFVQGTTSSGQLDAVSYVASTDCGRTFSQPKTVTSFLTYSRQDTVSAEPVPAQTAIDDPMFSGSDASLGGLARDCGDFQNHCASGYTFFRQDTQARSSADQKDRQHEYVYIVYDPSKPGTEVSTGTTYGSITSGIGSQSAIYFIRLDGATGQHTIPALIDAELIGHQLFPDISADGGVLHAMWWDSRLDPNYSAKRPVGNDSAGVTSASLDVWAAKSTDFGDSWTGHRRITTVSSNPNYEQFDNRTVPFAGD